MVRKAKKTGEIYGHAGIPDLVHLFEKYTDHIILFLLTSAVGSTKTLGRPVRDPLTRERCHCGSRKR
jgi:hypothetical protein